MAEIMFETFNVKGLYIGVPAVLALVSPSLVSLYLFKIVLPIPKIEPGPPPYFKISPVFLVQYGTAVFYLRTHRLQINKGSLYLCTVGVCGVVS